MQSDLKMCPFCGSDGEYHSDKGPTGEVYAWVGCNQCDAMSVHCDVRSMQPEETHPIDAWNTRASDAEITRLTEALRAAEEREKALREALEPFAFLEMEKEEGLADTQYVWETIYSDRVQDWFSFEEIHATRAALKGPSHDAG